MTSNRIWGYPGSSYRRNMPVRPWPVILFSGRAVRSQHCAGDVFSVVRPEQSFTFNAGVGRGAGDGYCTHASLLIGSRCVKSSTATRNFRRMLKTADGARNFRQNRLLALAFNRDITLRLVCCCNFAGQRRSPQFANVCRLGVTLSLLTQQRTLMTLLTFSCYRRS